MNHIVTLLKRYRRVWTGGLGLLVLALSACGSLPEPQLDAEPGRYAYVTTVDVTDADTPESLEAAYGGSVVVWQPAAGFAVMGLHERPADLSLLSLLDTNLDVISTPVTAQGYTAWSGGYTAWSGGYTAWSGGYTAWSGGSSAPTTFGENLDVWKQVKLEQGQRRAPNLGHGVKVAVIDTGIDLHHPAFKGRLAPQSDWRDFVDGDNVPQDEQGSGSSGGYGHGTAVAGVIVQVAPNATILPIRVLRPDGSGDVTAVASAIDWAIHRGARVINLSLGTATPNATLTRMVTYAASRNVLLVSSSGNTGDTSVTYPAADSLSHQTGGHAALGIGSVNRNDTKSSFSTYGSSLEMVAPGEDIRTSYPNGGTVGATGTSFAAPIVSGAAALAFGQSPDTTAARIETAIRSTAGGDTKENPLYNLGSGRLDVNAALAWMGF